MQAELSYGDTKISLPVIEGTEQEKAIDISKLRSQTGLITLDNGYVNTGSCESKITFIDGEKGILRYRGYEIKDVCDNCDFLETAYLVMYGELPTQEEYDRLKMEIADQYLVDEKILHIMEAFPRTTHPMALMIGLVSSLSGFYSAQTKTEDERRNAVVKLMAKMPVMMAWTYRALNGLPRVQADRRLNYAANFLHMMFKDPTDRKEVDPEVAKALDMLLILHADHEQNCSTATVRVVGSSGVNLYTAIAGGMCSLWGPLHGGANQAVIEMLTQIHEDGGNIPKYIEMAKDKDSDFRLMGFGHRVYKNFDPRARIIKKHCDIVLSKLNVNDPLLNLAKKLEEAALNDPYFSDRKLYPNVDFYSGIMYKAMGIPTSMFTPMFALGRLPGWIGQWLELMADPKLRIGRPRQVYQGSPLRTVDSKVVNS